MIEDMDMLCDGHKYPGRILSTIKCKSDNDTISMCLDLDQLTLSYSVNDQDKIMGFTEIEKTEYKAAVYTYWLDCSVQLIECARIP